ncbi:uncharacterized protein LOC107045963 isoform X1 [Diachasma alloeum]|uniref:uncharacterized protein LOC107045963 isoform X1 n=1 Tax=Diachasma alloeum TaxID=454923 RepID=UPI0007383D79|nr:uncharacterized protein LOC107045963 isoform X1 [Diachasma alloeum]
MEKSTSSDHATIHQEQKTDSSSVSVQVQPKLAGGSAATRSIRNDFDPSRKKRHVCDLITSTVGVFGEESTVGNSTEPSEENFQNFDEILDTDSSAKSKDDKVVSSEKPDINVPKVDTPESSNISVNLLDTALVEALASCRGGLVPSLQWQHLLGANLVYRPCPL